MRLPLAFAALLLLTAPAIALEPMPADGDWACELGAKVLGGFNVDGESYRYTRPDGRKRGGDLALYLDGVTYDIESGVLKDEFGVTQIRYGDDGGVDKLTLSSGDLADMAAVGTCFRPEPS